MTIYDVVSDITRTSERSPVSPACWWDGKGEAGRVGSASPAITSCPGAPERPGPRSLRPTGPGVCLDVGGGFARWGFTFVPDGAATKPTGSWSFMPSGIAMLQEKYGDRAAAEIDERTRQAYHGIPRTLVAIKRIAESS